MLLLYINRKQYKGSVTAASRLILNDLKRTKSRSLGFYILLSSKATKLRPYVTIKH